MMFGFVDANCGNSLSAGGQLEQPSEVNNSRTAKLENAPVIFLARTLLSWGFFFSPAKPEQAAIATMKIIRSHFINASYEIAQASCCGNDKWHIHYSKKSSQ